MPQRIFLEKRRHHPHHPVHIAAKIVAPGHIAPVPCVVREISPAGAKLELDPDWVIPKTFWLRIDFDSCLHQCRLVWREGSAAGVEFPPGHDKTWWDHSQVFAKPTERN